MIDKINIDKTNAWPFVEAKKIIRERKKNIESKGKITLQTGMAQAVYLILEHSVKLREPQ